MVEVNTGIDGAMNGSRTAIVRGDVLEISTASGGMLDVLLIDATDRTVRSARGVGSFRMVVGDLSEGHYLLRMTDAQGSTA